jgi:hypothetical protein
MRFKVMLISAALGLLAGACTGPLPPEVDDGLPADAGPPIPDGQDRLCVDPAGDYDGDGIPNGEEGCLVGRDSDGDRIPDWQDNDADGDKVPDHVEKGARDPTGKCKNPGKLGVTTWPCDTDGDRLPDYLDKDSDGEGLMDGEEDFNGDGLLGCCLTVCKKPGATQLKCQLTTDGCGRGQRCVGGRCMPDAAFNCSEGETSPKRKDTFGDGRLDSQRGTFICRAATEERPQGRKAVLLKRSELSRGDWRLALETTASYGEMTIANPGSKMAAAAIDHAGSNEEVAGFVLSKAATRAKVSDELSALISAITSNPPGGSGTTVTLRASGTVVKSHDQYDSVKETYLDLQLASATDVSTARNAVVAAMLGKSMAELTNLPQAYGSSTSSMLLKFTTVRRFNFKKDAQGNLVDDGDRSKWRLVVIGAVASKANYENPKRKTGYIADDLSNGTALAVSVDVLESECDVANIISLPIADIIWVVDESGSMDNNRTDIVNNANNFFSRALSSGLDFRMGVTNVCSPTGSYKAAVGRFCSKISSSRTDMGGTDRFLLPSEQTIYSSCVQNPPGYEGGSEYGLVNAKEAVKLHLPRALGDPSKIRPNATLVIIVATDEFPQSLYSTIGSSNIRTCTLPASTQAAVDSAVQQYLNLFSGVTDPEATAMFHVIGGTCSNSCSAYVAHGYKELAQKLKGQWADVCQKNLGNTLQVIIDSIIGAASPVVLDYVPISASLAVALDAVQVQRDRISGFDYRSANNSLVFINVKYKKGSQVIASYNRWGRNRVPK